MSILRLQIPRVRNDTWSRADFEWDPGNNQYICPEGQPLKQLRRNYSDPNRGPTGKGVAKYKALKHLSGLPIEDEVLSDSRCTQDHVRRTRRCPAGRPSYFQAQAVCDLDAVAKERRDAFRAPQTHPWLEAAPITWSLSGSRPCHDPAGQCMWRNDEFLLAATAQNLRKLGKIFPAAQQTRKAC